MDGARQAVLDALNGDAERVDPAVRRGLIALAASVDGLSAQVASMNRRLTVAAGSVTTAFATVAAALFSRLL